VRFSQRGGAGSLGTRAPVGAAGLGWGEAWRGTCRGAGGLPQHPAAARRGYALIASLLSPQLRGFTPSSVINTSGVLTTYCNTLFSATRVPFFYLPDNQSSVKSRSGIQSSVWVEEQLDHCCKWGNANSISLKKKKKIHIYTQNCLIH